MLRVAWRRVAASREGLEVVVGSARGKGPKKEKPEVRRMLTRRRSSTSWWLARGDGGCGIDDDRCMASVVKGWGNGLGRSESEDGRARRSMWLGRQAHRSYAMGDVLRDVATFVCACVCTTRGRMVRTQGGGGSMMSHRQRTGFHVVPG